MIFEDGGYIRQFFQDTISVMKTSISVSGNKGFKKEKDAALLDASGKEGSPKS
jgi:hypothetical protein